MASACQALPTSLAQFKSVVSALLSWAQRSSLSQRSLAAQPACDDRPESVASATNLLDLASLSEIADALRSLDARLLTADGSHLVQKCLMEAIRDLNRPATKRKGRRTGKSPSASLSFVNSFGFQRRFYSTQSRNTGGIGKLSYDRSFPSFWPIQTDKDSGKSPPKDELESIRQDIDKADFGDVNQVNKIQLRLITAAVDVLGQEQSRSKPDSRVASRLLSLFFVIFLLYMALQVLASLSGGGEGDGFSLSFRSPNEVQAESVETNFGDVRGADEAKAELQEVVEYLRDPERFSKLGGRLPKGVLLVGPPGCGKTLLARAVAGEADVAFFHAAGSEFDEVLVGQGARRVRSLFAAAKKKAPCVLFIDEIDSVGGKRVMTNLHPYANQTVNQLLTEMDGFMQNEGLIIIGATNRKEDLDKALLRAGRFDSEVAISLPDLKGRADIFDLYLKRITLGDDVDVERLAKQTIGFSGADIENLINQAAVRAAADGMSAVDMAHLDDSRDRIQMGPERKAGRLPDVEVNKCTAYHEAGHTLVALYTKDAVPVHKVTIIPRGSSLGHTAMMPDKDNYQTTRGQMQAQLDVLMGGRVAEELIFGADRVTTGASNDLKHATSIATAMVKTFGMSDKVGLRDFTLVERDSSFMSTPETLSPATREAIDTEIRRLLHESYERATALLRARSVEHHRLANALLDHETLTVDEVRQVIAGRKLRA